MKTKTQGYICPQTKKQCDDECCVSAEDCHIEASFGIVSDCEPPKQETTFEEAKKYLSHKGYGKGSNFTLNCVANLMIEWQKEQDKKCYHPLTERKHTSDTHFECTICGYNNY